MMTPAKLELSGIAKHFQGIIAIDCVSFVAEGAKVTGLIGPNGSGKTTTMNVITGLYAPDAGHILFDGQDISRMRPDQIAALGIARTFQNIRLLSEQTTTENVMLGAHLHQSATVIDAFLRLPRLKGSEELALARCKQILEMVGIAHLSDVVVGSLPYGDRRRVEIARALAAEPRMLLLDEPAAGMNLAEKHQLADLISKIRDLGITVLLIEHDIDFVARSSDHIVVLNFGREIAEGAPEEVRQMPSVIEAYLGSEDA